MAAVHVVNVGFFTVDADSGEKLDKSSVETTLNQFRNTASQHLIIPTPEVPNSLTSPTIKDYLIAEAAAGFILNHMDQSMIITYG